MAMTPTERKERARWQRIFRVYGITEKEYGLIDLGYCPICLKPWSDTTRPCVDHDHHTGRVRGLLCSYCNRYRVGHFHDPEVVARIYNYLLGAKSLPDWVVPKKKRKKKKRGRTKNV